MANLKLPKELHPGFSQFGKHPVVPVVMDTAHQDSGKAVHYYIARGNIPVSVGKTSLGGNLPLGTAVAGPFGQGVSNSAERFGAWNGVDSYPFTLYGRWFTQDGITTGSPVNLMEWGRFGGGITTRIRMQCNISNVTASIDWGGTAVSGAVVSHNSILNDPNTAVVDFFVDFVSSTEKTLYLYINGKLEGSATGTTDTSSTDSTAFSELQRLQFSANSKTTTLQMLTFNNLVSKDSYVSNPYQLLKPAIDITYFTSTAGVGATTITTTLDAILKKTQSKTTTLDAILKQVQTLTTDLDSILKKTQTKTTTLDSTLQKTQTKTTTLDAVLEGGGTKTTTLDSVLQKTQSKTTTLDGILQKLQTKNTTLDSILKKTFELTTTLDAVLTTPGAKLITTNLDSILQKTIEVTTTVDAILRKTFSKTTSLDSYLKARKLLTTSIDAALKGTQSATITIDAILTSGEVWVVQANSSDIWTVQTNNSDTWTVV